MKFQFLNYRKLFLKKSLKIIVQKLIGHRLENSYIKTLNDQLILCQRQDTEEIIGVKYLHNSLSFSPTISADNDGAVAALSPLSLVVRSTSYETDAQCGRPRP